MESRLDREFEGIQGQFNNIISNIKHFKSDSTDIHDRNIHLSVSLDNRMVMNLSGQSVSSAVPSRPQERRSAQFGFNLLNRRNVVRPKVNRATSGPKVHNLKTINERLKYILVTKNGEIISLHKNTKEDLDPTLEQKKVDYIYLLNRFNTLPKDKRNLLAYLSNKFSKWNNIEKEIVTNIFSSLSETPKRVGNLFNTINNNYCTACYKMSQKKHKCIHFDCTGMCQECIQEVTSTSACPACKKPQILTCPICIEKWNVRSCKILNCGHGICYKCCNRKWNEMGDGITICPQCRK